MGIDLTFCHTLSSSDRHRKPTTRHEDRVQRVQSLQVWQHSDRGYLVDLVRRNERQRRVELQRFVVFVTVQKDIPFVASNGTVAGFDRVHSNNTEKNKNNSFGEDLVEHVAEHVVEEHLVGECVAENLVAEHVAGEIAAETFVMPGLGLLFGLPM